MAVDQEGGQRAESNRRAKRRLLLERRWRTRKLAALGRIYYSSSLRSFVRARRSRWAAAAAARRVVVAAAPVVAAAAASGGSSTVVVRTPGVQPLPSALGPRCASQLEGASQPSARRVRPSAEGRASARFSETLTHKLTALRDMLVARGCPPVEAGRATDARVYEGWEFFSLSRSGCLRVLGRVKTGWQGLGSSGRGSINSSSQLIDELEPRLHCMYAPTTHSTHARVRSSLGLCIHSQR